MDDYRCVDECESDEFVLTASFNGGVNEWDLHCGNGHLAWPTTGVTLDCKVRKED